MIVVWLVTGLAGALVQLGRDRKDKQVSWTGRTGSFRDWRLRNGNVFATRGRGVDRIDHGRQGQVKAGTGAFTLPVTFPARIGEPAGHTSPEELIAAAHAACYAMALNAHGRTQGRVDCEDACDRDGHRRQGRGRASRSRRRS